jgi:hypothetical protein
MILSLLVVTALWAEPPAPAAPKTEAAPPLTYAPPKAADAKEAQLVCRTEAVLGSRLPVRRCRTVADIRDRQQQDREAIEHAQILQEPSK